MKTANRTELLAWTPIALAEADVALEQAGKEFADAGCRMQAAKVAVLRVHLTDLLRQVAELTEA
jgi:hypothetical protein